MAFNTKFDAINQIITRQMDLADACRTYYASVCGKNGATEYDYWKNVSGSTSGCLGDIKAQYLRAYLTPMQGTVNDLERQYWNQKVAGTSANGAAIPNVPFIIDQYNGKWTVVGGSVMLNGSPAQSTSNVVGMLFYNGVIYHYNNSNAWYYWDGVYWQFQNGGNPSLPTRMFYGANGHYDYPSNFDGAHLVTYLKALGATSYRVTWENSTDSLNKVVAVCQALIPAGIQVVVCIDGIPVNPSNGVRWADEATAYTYGYTSGQTVAAACGPVGVVLYETGNELTRNNCILNTNYMGTYIGDYDNTAFTIMRGVIRGMTDGVRQTQGNAKIISNAFCVADIAASDALWNGTQPDGTSGHPTVRWDITSWHNYEIYGDMWWISYDGDGTVRFDMLNYIKNAYGKPIIITEIGPIPEHSLAQKVTWFNYTYGYLYAHRAQYNIMSLQLYQLMGDPWGIVDGYGAPIDPYYSAVKNFIAAQPDS